MRVESLLSLSSGNIISSGIAVKDLGARRRAGQVASNKKHAQFF
jgi:hypothetical protein